jgi:hypothetical protein
MHLAGSGGLHLLASLGEALRLVFLGEEDAVEGDNLYFGDGIGYETVAA